VLFLAPEPLGPNTLGPTHRTVKLAEAVAEHCAVTLAAPGPSTFPDGPFRTIETGPLHDQDLVSALAGQDVAVVQPLFSPRQLLRARRSVPRLVVDMLAPLALEAAEIGADPRERAAAARWRIREQIAHLKLADLVLCSNDRQRDLAIGAALAAGAGGWRRPIEDRIVVVPFGIDDVPPKPTRAPLRASGLVSDDERIAIWAGGMWNWFDPLTAVRAAEILRPKRPDLRLVFVGYEHPDSVHRGAHEGAKTEALEYVRDRGLEESVVLRPNWLKRDDYLDHLLEADVGLSLNRPTLEGRFASRTRVLDYLGAGLPVVCTHGDALAELVASEELGSVIDAHDAPACAAAMDRWTNGARASLRDGGVLERLRWRNVSRPLVEFCVDPAPVEPVARREGLGMALRSYPAFLNAAYRSDAAELRRAAGRHVRRITRARRAR
jgi:glycosyltransferase involved in cell wall biosynthesis